MYQAIYYDYSTYSIFLRDDNDGWSNFKPKHQLYRRVPSKCEDSFPVLTGGYAIPLKEKGYTKLDSSILEKDINKELLVLRDLYYKHENEIPKWQNIIHLDIETEILGSLTVKFIQEAIAPITSISLLDKTTKQKICFITDKSKEITKIEEEDK